MAVAVGGSLKTRGSLWFPEDVFIVQAAVGRVSYRQAGTVRTGPGAPPKAPVRSRRVCLLFGGEEERW